MSMPKIRFSYDYEKLPRVWDGTQATLMGVCYVDSMLDLKNRLPNLVENDTKIRGSQNHFAFHFYSGLILTFFHVNTGTLFTTIRSYNSEKDEYYRGLVGETFLMERIYTEKSG